MLLNIAFFVPFGWLVARRWGWARALAGGALLTLGIEMAQTLIPGRYPTAGDLVANAAGAGLGAWLAVRARQIAAPAAVLGIVGVLGPLWLLAPDPPPGTYYGQWTARFGGMEHYEGRIVRARVGGVETPSRRSDASDVLREAIGKDGPIELTFVAGPPTRSLAPVFSVFDDRRRRIFLLGADGTDIVVYRWTRATTMRLDTAPLRWRGAMGDIERGDTVDLLYERSGRSPCLTLDGSTRCDTAPSQGKGWSILHSLGGRDLGPLEGVVDGLWMASLGLSMALPRWPARVRASALLITGLLSLGAATHLPYLTASLLLVAALWVGGAIGLLLRRGGSRS